MNIQNIAFIAGLPILSVSAILVFIRLWRGPSLADRVIALELMTMLGVGTCSLYAIATDQKVFLDVAMLVTLLSFLGTVAFAYYIERRNS